MLRTVGMICEIRYNFCHARLKPRFLLHGELPWYILLWEATYQEGMVRSRAHANAPHLPAHCAPSFQANLS